MPHDFKVEGIISKKRWPFKQGLLFPTRVGFRALHVSMYLCLLHCCSISIFLFTQQVFMITANVPGVKVNLRGKYLLND